MLKNVYKACFIVLAGLVGTANSLEIRPFHELLFPTKVKITHDKGGNESTRKMDSDVEFMGGSEVLFAPENIPIRYGFGIGVKSAQQKGDTIITPAMLPLWGVITYDPFKGKYPVSPYVVARAGTLMPLTGNGNWWEKPLNFNVNGGIGAIFPYNIGFEIVYDYTSVLKSFKSIDTKFRVNSGRVALVLSVGFNIGGESAPKSEEPKGYDASDFTAETATEEQPAETQESSGFDYSGGAYDSSESDTTATSSETDYGYGASEETSSEPAEEAPASEESSESVAEESAAEEAAAEPEAESATEPEPEPEAEPAPEPEPKPAAKKSSKKSSKKAAKKSSKKSTKKSAKKSKKKK